MMSDEHMTAEGLERLKERLREMEAQLLVLQRYKGEDAIHQGDNWHDNPTLYQAEAQERALMLEVSKLKERIACAIIIAPPREANSVVLGCRVEVRFADGSVEMYQVLGEADSNPRAGIISYRSPLGQALMDRSVGDRATYEVRGSTVQVEILSVTAT